MARVIPGSTICQTKSVSNNSISLYGQLFSKNLNPTMKFLFEPPSGQKFSMKKHVFGLTLAMGFSPRKRYHKQNSTKYKNDHKKIFFYKNF